MNVNPLAPSRYTNTAIALHWLHAGLIVGLLLLGYLLSELPKGPERSGLIAIHKSFGLCAFALVAVRLFWRKRHAPPPSPLPEKEARLAHLGHVLLYLLLVAVPLCGYLSASFTKYPMKFFGLPLPKAGWPNDGINAVFNLLHRGGAWLLAILILAHLAAVLRHALRGDGTLQRILPQRRLH